MERQKLNITSEHVGIVVDMLIPRVQKMAKIEPHWEEILSTLREISCNGISPEAEQKRLINALTPNYRWTGRQMRQIGSITAGAVTDLQETIMAVNGSVDPISRKVVIGALGLARNIHNLKL